jgi:hypothetical protein
MSTIYTSVDNGHRHTIELPSCLRHNPTPVMPSKTPPSTPIIVPILGLAAGAAIVYAVSKKSASGTTLMPRPIPVSFDPLTADQRRPYLQAASVQLAALGFPPANAATPASDDILSALARFGQADANRLQAIQSASPNQTSRAFDLLDREYRRVKGLPAPDAATPTAPAPAPVPTNPPRNVTESTTPDPREAWYQDMLNRLRTKLDQLGAMAGGGDQYWRAVLWLNGAHIPGFAVPENSVNRYDALKYVSEIVFAQPVTRPAGNVIPIRVDDARIVEFLAIAKLSPAGWLALTRAQKIATIARVRAAYSPDRVIAAIDAWCLRPRVASRLRPAGDATPQSQSSGTPWGLIALFGVGFGFMEWLKISSGAHMAGKH